MATERDRFNWREVRAELARQRITTKRFAAACGLSYSLVSRILRGHEPGELARIKLARGVDWLLSQCHEQLEANQGTKYTLWLPA